MQRIYLGYRLPENAGRFALVDDDLYEMIAAYSWQAVSTPSTVYAKTNSIRGLNSVGMHQLVLSPKPPLYPHHIDTDGLNNQRDNLELTTQQVNVRHQGGHKRSTSQFKGVCFNKTARKWHAQITVSGRKYFLGLHENELEAAHAYNEAAREYYGDKCYLNDLQ